MEKIINKIKLIFHWIKYKQCLADSFGFTSERIPHHYSYYQIKQDLGFKLSEENQIWYDNLSKDNLFNIITRSKIKV